EDIFDVVLAESAVDAPVDARAISKVGVNEDDQEEEFDVKNFINRFQAKKEETLDNLPFRTVRSFFTEKQRSIHVSAEKEKYDALTEQQKQEANAAQELKLAPKSPLAVSEGRATNASTEVNGSVQQSEDAKTQRIKNIASRFEAKKEQSLDDLKFRTVRSFFTEEERSVRVGAEREKYNALTQQQQQEANATKTVIQSEQSHDVVSESVDATVHGDRSRYSTSEKAEHVVSEAVTEGVSVENKSSGITTPENKTKQRIKNIASRFELAAKKEQSLDDLKFRTVRSFFTEEQRSIRVAAERERYNALAEQQKHESSLANGEGDENRDVSDEKPHDGELVHRRLSGAMKQLAVDKETPVKNIASRFEVAAKKEQSLDDLQYRTVRSFFTEEERSIRVAAEREKYNALTEQQKQELKLGHADRDEVGDEKLRDGEHSNRRLSGAANQVTVDKGTPVKNIASRFEGKKEQSLDDLQYRTVRSFFTEEERSIRVAAEREKYNALTEQQKQDMKNAEQKQKKEAQRESTEGIAATNTVGNDVTEDVTSVVCVEESIVATASSESSAEVAEVKTVEGMTVASGSVNEPVEMAIETVTIEEVVECDANDAAALSATAENVVEETTRGTVITQTSVVDVEAKKSSNEAELETSSAAATCQEGEKRGEFVSESSSQDAASTLIATSSDHTVKEVVTEEHTHAHAEVIETSASKVVASKTVTAPAARAAAEEKVALEFLGQGGRLPIHVIILIVCILIAVFIMLVSRG
uniref:Uncharacterized protein n=1 Tax=Globisporangium ultimum (strain ATCC 200006 / CBS 805.95 / DAOM BR144) TaxID=431595 RepID=K3WCV5_GLOUD